MPKTKVMLIGALPVGFPANYSANPNGPQPVGYKNYFPNQPTVREQPQNLLRPTFEGGPFATISSGAPSVPLDVHMLSGLGRLRGNGNGPMPTNPAVFDPTKELTPEEVEQLNYVERYQALVVRNPQLALGAIGWTMFALRGLGATIGAYHGYKRNKSGWSAAGYGVAGFLFPLITTGVGLAQGLAQPKRG